MGNAHIPCREEFCRGIDTFQKHETRDAMYKVATFLISHFWGKASDTADGLGVLLLTWNQAFYRYGSFDFDKLEKCIADNFDSIENFRNRNISSLSNSDEDEIKLLFKRFLDALRVDSGENRIRRSPVAVAKAFHLLAPGFFPLWDYKIAQAYGCSYHGNPAEAYVSFCRITRSIADQLKEYVVRTDKEVPKLIDEYDYSKYTRGWFYENGP